MTSQLSAVELLNLGDEGRIQPVLNKYWPYVVGVSIGVTTGALVNFATRRPVMSGIQKHALLTVGWCGLLSYVQDKRNAYFAERDAVLRHYVELHPEDFCEPPKKKIGEVLEQWIPVR